MKNRFYRNTDESHKRLKASEKAKNDKRRPQSHLGDGAPKALIADDNAEAAQLIQIVMLNFGFETTLAFDGKQALDEISKTAFDLIFLDFDMPGLNGFEVLSKIEEVRFQNLTQCKKWRLLPIVTYTGFETEKLLVPEENGFYIAGHCQKPATLPQLTTLTGTMIADLGIVPPARSLPDANALDPRK